MILGGDWRLFAVICCYLLSFCIYSWLFVVIRGYWWLLAGINLRLFAVIALVTGYLLQLQVVGCYYRLLAVITNISGYLLLLAVIGAYLHWRLLAVINGYWRLLAVGGYFTLFAIICCYW